MQHAMGHSKIEITLNVYGHLLKERDDAHKENGGGAGRGDTGEETTTPVFGDARIIGTGHSTGPPIA